MRFLDRLRGRRSAHHRHDAADLERLDVVSPGWRAIDRAIATVHGDSEPTRHWGTIRRWRFGGPDPLDGMSAYQVDDPPHWHYVSYGLTELHQKESDDPATSGWGFELTFRLARQPDDDEPPIWPVNVLQNLARYVFQSGNVLRPGDHTDMNGPIALDHPDTAIRAAIFVEDPQLAPIDSINGHLEFVQLVGTTLDEYEAAQEWDTDQIAAILREASPLLVTDLDRRSVLALPGVRDRVAAGIERDGSSMSGVMVETLSVRPEGEALTIVIGAGAIERIAGLMRGRIGHGRSFWIRAGETALIFGPGDTFAWHVGPDAFHVTLAPDDVERFVRLVQPAVGRYVVAPDGLVVVEVETTIIRDQDDREIGRIG